MAEFKFTQQVEEPAISDIVSAALGVSSSAKFAQADLGKPVKLGDSQNYVLCDAGDEIEGIVTSVEPWTVNDGFSFGGVKRRGRFVAEVGANQGGTPMAIDDFVVADEQVALGTAGVAKVKTGVPASQGTEAPYTYVAGTPSTFMWRVIRIMSGAGAAGSKVLLERV